jgi:hypothetical protein
MDLGAITNAAFAGVAVFGLALAAFAILAARRARSPRMVLVAVGFLLVAIQGILVGVELFTGGASESLLLFVCAVFEAGLLAVFFAATVVR